MREDACNLYTQIHGSVADRVVRTGSHPVVLVPPRTDYMANRDVHLRRGLVPVDGSTTALSVVDHLLALRNAHELACCSFRSCHPSPTTGEHRNQNRS